MVPILVQAIVLLAVLALVFYIVKAIIDFLQLSRDLANIAGLILLLLWLVWILTTLGLLPPLTVGTPPA